MANKKANKPAKKPERVFHGFVECNLDADQKAHAKAWVQTNPPTWEYLSELVDSEYKVSFAYDNYHSTYQCSLTCVKHGNPNEGWCLVARAPDAMSAFGMVVYKHTMILDGVWTDGNNGSQVEQDWG